MPRVSTDPRHPARLAPLLLGLVLLASAWPAAAGEPFENGQWLEIEGMVTDAGGEPLPRVRVVLEASRSYFSLRGMERREKDLRQVTATPDDSGEYRLRWLWDDYFNTFEVTVVVAVPRGGSNELHVLKQVDMTTRLEQGGPPRVVLPLVVEDASLARELHRFETQITSADEERIYREMGYPDEVKLAEDPREISWWYFDRGKVYHFAAGELEEVVAFEPVGQPATDHGGPRR